MIFFFRQQHLSPAGDTEKMTQTQKIKKNALWRRKRNWRNREMKKKRKMKKRAKKAFFYGVGIVRPWKEGKEQMQIWVEKKNALEKMKKKYRKYIITLRQQSWLLAPGDCEVWTTDKKMHIIHMKVNIWFEFPWWSSEKNKRIINMQTWKLKSFGYKE